MSLTFQKYQRHNGKQHVSSLVFSLEAKLCVELVLYHLSRTPSLALVLIPLVFEKGIEL
jgi:hypothetical protein